jgi:hypothetical protein
MFWWRHTTKQKELAKQPNKRKKKNKHVQPDRCGSSNKNDWLEVVKLNMTLVKQIFIRNKNTLMEITSKYWFYNATFEEWMDL